MAVLGVVVGLVMWSKKGEKHDFFSTFSHCLVSIELHHIHLSHVIFIQLHYQLVTWRLYSVNQVVEM